MNDEILLALGRLEGKVDSLITTQTIHNEELGRHDKRLRDLEQSKSWVLGAAAAIGAIASILVNMIGGRFSG